MAFLLTIPLIECFAILDTANFSECLYRWSKEILSTLQGQLTQTNIDGKVLCGTAKSGQKKSGICIISAWASEHHLVLGQQKVDGKSNEKTAIPELLQCLDLNQSLVSIDAIVCQKKNADLIVNRQGAYLLSLKKNNKHMFEQVSSRMLQIYNQLPYYKDVDFGSGRIETRTCYVENKLCLYDDLASWTHLKSIIMVESKRESKGESTTEYRFYLSSLMATPEDFNKWVRGHWSIENGLHWQLDITFSEDVQRTKTGNATENFATLPKLALQILNQVQDKESIKNRGKMAGWSDSYLVDMLANLRE